MFPYPSGNLHLGHLRVYTVADVLYRYQTMCGLTAFQPMGWDAFGLPAENAAIDRGISPQTWTSRNIKHMQEQMDSAMLLGLDWSRELSTCDPSYYRWTQWLFVKLYKAGLAYHRSAFVNWDPVDQTVLADELVDEQGKSWRSGAVVERRPLKQWYFRTSAFAKSLLDGLKEIEGNQWRDVIQMQRGWLGTLDGTQMEFDVLCNSQPRDSPILPTDQKCDEVGRVQVFTRQPGLAVADFISHIEVNPGSIYFEDQFREPPDQRGINSSRKLILLSNYTPSPNGLQCKPHINSTAAASPWPERLAVTARHPFTDRLIPMIRQPTFLTEVHVEAYPDKLCFTLESSANATTSHSQFSKAPGRLSRLDEYVELHEVAVADIADCRLNTPVSKLDGVLVSQSDDVAMEMLRTTSRGGYWTSELRTDWLVSRQRYWGTPIPIVHCEKCGTVPVPEDQLPVRLPPLDGPLKRGDAPLRDNAEWRRTNCPSCGGPADRETDTLDTFVDSSWYYLRYLDPNNAHQICDPQKAASGLPVNVYIGGIEHGIRHLYYARFMAHFLHQIGVLSCREPFRQFLPMGLVLGKTFSEPRTGRYVPSEDVQVQTTEKGRSTWIESRSGVALRMEWDKMSKSKLNGVDPMEVVKRLGVELVRLTMLANVGPHRARKWQEDGVIRGISNWQSKMTRLVDNCVQFTGDGKNSTWHLSWGQDDPLWQDKSLLVEPLARTIHQVNSYYGDSFVLSAAIARLQELTELLRRHAPPSANAPGPTSFIYLRALADMTVMLAPLAPVLACELWSELHRACYERAPQQVWEMLQSRRVSPGDNQSTSFDSFLHWPYDLEEIVLQQPFPVFTDASALDCQDVPHIKKEKKKKNASV